MDASQSLSDLRSIGEYRILHRLGRGGMGEVVLAEDPRLLRQVAIKRLHTDRGEESDERSEVRRRRFRREAQTLAKLRHPAIVQVYELFSVDGEDYLVMEYVPGPNLRQMIEEEGPMPADEVLELAVHLAEGLVHAHRHGVVHRDLKTDNVLLDPDGTPRIADFGLARSMMYLDGDGSLTATGQVLGTLRSMAPEQLTGGPVDERTDLYALGVLLSETLLGSSPFKASSRRETLRRVLTEPPPPLAPTGAPEGLCRLLEQLLEKEPNLRPRHTDEVLVRLQRLSLELEATWSQPEIDSVEIAGTVGSETRPTEPEAANTEPVNSADSNSSSRRASHPYTAIFAVLAIAAGIWAVVRSTVVEAPKPLYVAVLATEVQGVEAEEAEVIAFSVRRAALRALGGLERVVSPGPAEVDAVAAGQTPREVARATAVDQVLTSEVRCDASECWLELARLDGTSGDVLWGASKQTLRTEPQLLAWATEQAVLSGLPRNRVHTGDVMPPEVISEVLRLYFADHHGESRLAPATMVSRLIELRQRYGSHVELEVWLANMASKAFATSHDPIWLERGREALDTAAALAPEDPKIPLTRAALELDAGNQDVAATILDEVDAMHRGSLHLDEIRSRLEMARGETDRALERMQRVVARRPSWARLYNLARMASEAGDLELTFDTLDALEERAPQSTAGRWLRASLELKFGDLDRAADLFRSLTAEFPAASTWSNLGLVHLLRRDAPRALEAFRHARALEGENPLVLLNLADAHLLDGDVAAALDLYADVDELLASATSTEIQALTTRAQARARLGRVDGAVADMEAAVRLAPENPAVRFEAALVYALVGDLTSARRNRQRALDLGYDDRWFSLAAFDVLRHPSRATPSGTGGS